MSKRIVSRIVLMVFLTSMLVSVFKFQFVKASDTIYIKADGSVDPSSAPINRDGNVYVFFDNINDSIVIERDNIVVDGGGYTLQGTGAYDSKGISLLGRSNVTIKDVKIREFWIGIYLGSSTGNVISGNNVTNSGLCCVMFDLSSDSNNLSGNSMSENAVAVKLDSSSNNIISANNITGNDAGVSLDSSFNNTLDGNNIENNEEDGIYLSSSSYNTISGNTATNNYYGIQFSSSYNNKLYHNNLIGNIQQVLISAGYANFLDDDLEGNYWSNYAGVDLDHDGIGDTPHVIDEDNSDNYPLMGTFSDLRATSQYCVQTICNSTISGFQFNGTAIRFYLTGESGITGFCRIRIPTALMNPPYKVLVDDTEVSHALLPRSNITHSYLYFTYDHSTCEIQITSESPPYDIAVTNVASWKTVVGQGYSVSLNVTVENQGDYTETFNVTAYVNTTMIETRELTLSSGKTATVTLTGNTTGTAKGNHTIGAYADPILGETDTTDNNYTDGWIIVAMVGDITGPNSWPDGKCDMRDVGMVARNFGKTVPPAPANCDITGPIRGLPDGKINMRDVGTVARHFGEKDP